MEKEEKITCRQIILEFLKERYGRRIAFGVVDSEVPNFGRRRYNKYYSPSTVSREFRKLRQVSRGLEKEMIKLVKVVPAEGEIRNYDIYEIEKYDPSQMNFFERES